MDTVPGASMQSPTDQMDWLIADILATASGKELTSPSPYVTSHHHHGNAFITSEVFRPEMSWRQVPTSPTPSPTASPQAFTDMALFNVSTSSEFSNTSLDNDFSSATYIGNYNDSLYASSPPTYIRSDFYDLTPPVYPASTSTSGHVSMDTTAPTMTSFSIDALLGCCDTSVSAECSDIPAEVTSHVPLKTGLQSLSDWDYFQRRRVARDASAVATSDVTSTSGVRPLYWCHGCEDMCSDVIEVDAYRNYHTSNAHPCRLKRDLHKQLGYISVHEGTSHTNKVKCGICQLIVSRHFFSKHIVKHNGHVCDVCGQEFISRSRLQDHRNAHTGATPWSCQQCTLSFSDRRHLAAHVRRHRPFAHFCPDCGKPFRTKYACATHQRIHTGNIKPFTCQEPGCNKAFAQKIQLRLHSRIHAC